MWNKYRSFFILIRVRTGQVNFSIPVALFLLDQTFDVLSDLVWLWETLSALWTGRLSEKTHNAGLSNSVNNMTIISSQVLQLCRETINELRCHGRWRMAEVETGTVRVYVDFI